MNAVNTYQLRDGYTISRVIKGGWQLSGDHGEVNRQAAIRDMLGFVDAGIVTFDCADIYTGVEEMIGEFIGLIRAERGSSAAEKLKVHTKFVPDYAQLNSMSKGYVTSIIDRSLQRLRLEQLHLVQFHWWDYQIPGHLDALRYLTELQQAGKIKQIGVTNFDGAHVAEICESGIDLVSAQVQYSLLDQRPATEFTDICRSNQVYLLCYGVLAGGFLTKKWLGERDPGHRFVNRSLVKYRLIIDEFGGWDLYQALLTVLDKIAAKHSVELSTVAIRYVLNLPQVAATIVGARYARYIPQTVAAFGFELDADDLLQINGVLKKRAGPSGPVYALERDKEGIHGRIMKYNLNEGE
ncbi:MAG: aldo/keto reductase [Chloroflexota bacterium]